MSLILESYDSLPYIDDDLPQHKRDAVEAQITRELKGTDASNPHPSLPTFEQPQFSDLVQTELDRVAAGKKVKDGVDLDRYEIPDEPSADADTKAWRKALRSAYSSNAYLSGRQVNLKLLEEWGKNAWLISNSQLQQLLASQEQELERLKKEIESVNKERKEAQEGSVGEIKALEDTWRDGIQRLVQVQMATEKVRQKVFERQGRLQNNVIVP